MRRGYGEDSLVVRVGMRIRRLATTTKTLAAIAKALRVTAVDLLNCDPENDDVGAIVEAMRSGRGVCGRLRRA